MSFGKSGELSCWEGRAWHRGACILAAGPMAGQVKTMTAQEHLTQLDNLFKAVADDTHSAGWDDTNGLT